MTVSTLGPSVKLLRARLAQKLAPCWFPSAKTSFSKCILDSCRGGKDNFMILTSVVEIIFTTFLIFEA